MMNSTGDDFSNYNPLTNAGQPPQDAPSVTGQSDYSDVSESSDRGWNSGAENKIAAARRQTERFARENPIPLIVGALAAGLAIGWALRHATHEDEPEIKTPLDRINWSFLSLPFLWPILKSVKEKAGDSAETIKDAARDGMGRVRNIDIDRYSKPLRKRWKTWTN